MLFRKEAIKQISLYADLLEFSGANKFKVNAFRGAANTLKRVEGDLEQMLHDGSITNIKGIGKGIQAFLYELSDNGAVSELDNLIGSILRQAPDSCQLPSPCF